MKRILCVLLLIAAIILLSISRKATAKEIENREVLDSPKYEIPEDLRHLLY